jgi:hypothetical protein
LEHIHVGLHGLDGFEIDDLADDRQTDLVAYPTQGPQSLFPQSLEAIGPIGVGLCADQWWGADWPYKSALLGETCQQFAGEYEARTDSQWTQPLGHFMVFEWAADVLSRTPSVDDK